MDKGKEIISLTKKQLWREGLNSCANKTFLTESLGGLPPANKLLDLKTDFCIHSSVLEPGSDRTELMDKIFEIQMKKIQLL